VVYYILLWFLNITIIRGGLCKLSEEVLKTEIKVLLDSIVDARDFIIMNIDYLDSKYDLGTISDLNIAKAYLTGISERIRAEADFGKL
jgi:hypothetical protein